MNPHLFEKIVSPFYHRVLKRDGVYNWYEFYLQSQWWPSERLVAYQWELFTKLIRHAYDHVPYYRELLHTHDLKPELIKDWSDFAKIPFLTKKIATENKDRIKAENIPDRRFISNSTSGSTGINFQFYSDRDAFPHKKALQMRLDKSMGMGVADREATIWGAHWDVRYAKKIITRVKRVIKNKMILSGYHLTEEDMSKYFRLIKAFDAQFLHGYPSTLHLFASFLERQGYTLQVKGVRSAGETLYDFQREVIERVFQAKVFNFYGCREVGMIAQESEYHDGLYVQAENVILEVVDEQGKPVLDTEGEIVVTDLHNYAWPFIRYRIGDRGILSSSAEQNGLGLPLLKKLVGRTFDLVRFPNGNTVGGTFWTLLLRSEKGIELFQVIQKSIDLIIINIVPNKEFNENIYDKLRNKIREYSGMNVEIKINLVDSIPVTKGGKLRFVISEINQQ